mmetsp:Transcript_48509/g.105177  ORF Transcript_48509/g.105177 Transcript_48509/m.105177 type:complete len:228 (+) Transcript_48509:409-1092(+)
MRGLRHVRLQHPCSSRYLSYGRCHLPPLVSMPGATRPIRSFEMAVQSLCVLEDRMSNSRPSTVVSASSCGNGADSFASRLFTVCPWCRPTASAAPTSTSRRARRTHCGCGSCARCASPSRSTGATGASSTTRRPRASREKCRSTSSLATRSRLSSATTRLRKRWPPRTTPSSRPSCSSLTRTRRASATRSAPWKCCEAMCASRPSWARSRCLASARSPDWTVAWRMV